MKVQVRSPKTEDRRPKEGRNPKSENGGTLIMPAGCRKDELTRCGWGTQPSTAMVAARRLRPSDFGLLSAFGFGDHSELALMSAFRNESDLLGELPIPAAALYGIHTVRALDNFPVALKPVAANLARAYGTVKLACAMTNRALGAWADD